MEMSACVGRAGDSGLSYSHKHIASDSPGGFLKEGLRFSNFQIMVDTNAPLNAAQSGVCQKTVSTGVFLCARCKPLLPGTVDSIVFTLQLGHIRSMHFKHKLP